MPLRAAHRSDQFQPRSHSPLCIVLVSLGVAKVDQHTVAHGTSPTKPPKRCTVSGDALVIGRNDLAEVFRVHARR